MFDKTLFDRNAFDRSVSSDSIDIKMLSRGDLAMKVVMRTTVPLSPFRGTGDMATAIIVQQRTSLRIDGGGDLGRTPVVLRLPLVVKLSGGGGLISGIAVRTPIPMKFSGVGAAAVSNQMIARQHMVGSFGGSGSIKIGLVMQTQISTVIRGDGHLSGKVALQLPLTLPMSGDGKLTLNRIGGRNENVLELIGINLLPGETVTIDTDLLQVLFGTREDVSSVTSDSVFFELFPGDNEITISTDTEEDLDVTTIWQNRWL